MSLWAAIPLEIIVYVAENHLDTLRDVICWANSCSEFRFLVQNPDQFARILRTHGRRHLSQYLAKEEIIPILDKMFPGEYFIGDRLVHDAIFGPIKPNNRDIHVYSQTGPMTGGLMDPFLSQYEYQDILFRDVFDIIDPGAVVRTTSISGKFDNHIFIAFHIVDNPREHITKSPHIKNFDFCKNFYSSRGEFFVGAPHLFLHRSYIFDIDQVTNEIFNGKVVWKYHYGLKTLYKFNKDTLDSGPLGAIFRSMCLLLDEDHEWTNQHLIFQQFCTIKHFIITYYQELGWKITVSKIDQAINRART